jgi:hypothetical protein
MHLTLTVSIEPYIMLLKFIVWSIFSLRKSVWVVKVISHITCPSPFAALMSTPGLGLVPSVCLAVIAWCGSGCFLWMYVMGKVFDHFRHENILKSVKVKLHLFNILNKGSFIDTPTCILTLMFHQNYNAWSGARCHFLVKDICTCINIKKI